MEQKEKKEKPLPFEESRNDESSFLFKWSVCESSQAAAGCSVCCSVSCCDCSGCWVVCVVGSSVIFSTWSFVSSTEKSKNDLNHNIQKND